MYKSHNLREHGSSGAGDTVYTWVNTDRHVINGRSVWFLMGGIRGIEREARVTTCGEVLVGICAGREVPRAARRSRWCRVVKHSHDLREHGSSGAVYAVYTWVNTDWYVINGRRVWFHMGGIRGVESEARVAVCGEVLVGVCAEREVPRAHSNGLGSEVDPAALVNLVDRSI